ncbi:MAG: hypothetical protein RL087_596, partial [Pseudomonadota bacterium]
MPARGPQATARKAVAFFLTTLALLATGAAQAQAQGQGQAQGNGAAPTASAPSA